jgi:hypothetical protein
MPTSSSLRNFCRICAASVLLFGLLVPAAQADVDAVPPRKIAALLQQLDSKSRQERVTAENALLKLGPAILDSLPPPDLLSNVAVREAVRRVRTQLEQIAAQESIQASRITLRGERTIRELVAGISDLTGNRVECAGVRVNVPEPDKGSVSRDTAEAQDPFLRKLTVDWQNEPFWSAIGHVESAGFRASYSSGGDSLELKPDDVGTMPTGARTQIFQAFRIETQPVERREIVGTGNVLLRVPLQILCEPRLRPLFLRCSMSDLALAAGTRRLSPFSPASRLEVPLGDGGRDAKLELSFVAPRALAVTEGLTLSGRMSLLTAALEREITFPKLSEAQGLTRRRGGVTVTVQETRVSPRDAASHSARISTQIGYEAKTNAFESHQIWIFHNRVFLRDKNGREHAPNDGFSTLFQADGTVGVEYRFSNLPEHTADWQFTYVAPTLLIDVPLDLSIARIPLAANRGD